MNKEKIFNELEESIGKVWEKITKDNNRNNISPEQAIRYESLINKLVKLMIEIRQQNEY